ncbi:bifunctional hydroxymethylpyrimidine kinase/phosphomethylpyrimidine kinase [Brackiella oedipodis]|uniref:bifunctional hydroxymethylpyrimidine kinase/phosphomethylpyrimidine kinase n=1 Tax=Brackiella oedipodis TaxID=124225 RepID=UPI00048DE468|nr:bifunctional hydroxymethylpyrimidine kinase/phosphomethylpyrimidine kinase [Brackiella oedipodis]
MQNPATSQAKSDYIPNTLSIAGVDPSGGAGILADVKTMSALGAYACAVVAGLTAQNTQSVTQVLPVDPSFVEQQLKTLFDDVRIDATKIGMLGQAKVIEVVAQVLHQRQTRNIILDPVMVAKSGDSLLEQVAVHTLKEALLPLSLMITPNLPEAGQLLKQRAPDNIKEMYVCAEKLHKLFKQTDERWVLLKGGHLSGNETMDLLFNGDQMLEYPGQRLHTKNTHGTGCTYSSAICALLPRAATVPEAVQKAKHYVHEAITQADRLQVGHGHGPLQHFWQWW